MLSQLNESDDVVGEGDAGARRARAELTVVQWMGCGLQAFLRCK